MDNENAIGIMKLIPGSIAPLVVAVGDPARSKYLSTLLDDPKCVGNNREYLTFTGTYKGVKVTVCSHGVGGGGSSMAFEELIQAGAKVLIRAGTCGSLQSDLKEGSLVVVNAAIRRDGVTDNLIYREYPAVAHHTVVAALEETLKQSDANFRTGMCVSEGCFYDGPLGNLNLFWQKTGVLSIEMECSVLFVIASIHGVMSGSILNVDNYIFERLQSTTNEYKPHREVVIEGNKRMCKLTLDAIIKLNPLVSSKL